MWDYVDGSLDEFRAKKGEFLSKTKIDSNLIQSSSSISTNNPNFSQTIDDTNKNVTTNPMDGKFPDEISNALKVSIKENQDKQGTKNNQQNS